MTEENLNVIYILTKMWMKLLVNWSIKVASFRIRHNCNYTNNLFTFHNQISQTVGIRGHVNVIGC